ncbi:MAG: tetratricopeptide repeat protein [Chitinophagales bacterium]|nr:tetratricopeptide repeat protein [Chitinophagales bacterium]
MIFMHQGAVLSKVVLLLCCACLLACKGNQTPQTVAGNPAGRETNAPKLSIVQRLKASEHLPVGERIALYRNLKKENADAYNFENEDELTMYGYSKLWENKTTEALEIFKLIAEQFPHSANAYDSLGEAYLALGDKEKSLSHYEKSLAMNPDNFGAEDQIERIKYPEKPVETPADKFSKVYTVQAYHDDLEQLGQNLLKVHPAALKFISEQDFRKLIAQKKALINERTTFAEFAWHCSEIIASIHCSHTEMGRFTLENEMLPPQLKFPLLTRLVDGKLYVIDALNTKDISTKDEILSINGVAVPQLLTNIYPHITAQGYIQTTKGHVFNMWTRVLIPYALGFPEKYTVVVKGKTAPIALNKVEGAIPVRYNPIYKCPDGLCLEFLDDQKTAVMSITTFNYYPFNNLDVFQAFVDKSMSEINAKGIKNLIIDVRWNGGGSQHASIHLLRYLVKSPFVYYSNVVFEGKTGKTAGEESFEPFENRFKGKLFFMMDGLGNSTTGHFMSLVKVLNLGTIVGEELGSNQFCSAGQKVCRLKNTKLVFYVANNIHESSATALPDETGILPDHTLRQSLDDYLNGTDRVKAFTIQLARQEK